ncbi:spexin prohormone 2 isoform X2 [Cebidichthys violaceus]
MNSSTAELDADNIDTDDQSSEEDVHAGPAGPLPVWAGSPSRVTDDHYHTPIQPGMVEPLTSRSRCPLGGQSPQCLMTYSDYLQEPQSSQYHLTGPEPGPPDFSQYSSVSAPWFTNEPVPWNMMQGDLRAPLASICVPQPVDQQQLQEGLTEFRTLITQPLVCAVGGDGEAALGPVFLTQTSAQGNDVGVLGTPSQHQQATRSLCEPRDLQPAARTSGALCEVKFRKPCRCTRSQCLKLYCECFSSGTMCGSCDCSNCHNNAEHEVKRRAAVKLCLGRNPAAFRSTTAGGMRERNKGCNCKRSGCLKNYCECYEANIKCSVSCKCVGCRNYVGGSQVGLKDTNDVIDERPVSVITPAVVEAVCECLLAKAEEAEFESECGALAEHMVLEEFGQCVARIVTAMFQDSTL